jgi:preprotein translocase SecE subunit
VARNRQRARSGRPPARRGGGPLPASAGGAGRPPIAEDPVAFADDDDDPVGGEEDAMTAAVSAFGTAPGAAPGAEGARPQRRGSLVGRTINFLEGCWAELRRVQWPDRQQVVQATGVVLGFVVLTGVFLGLADFVAGKLVNAII